MPYALASGDSAVAFFFEDPLRAGHPSNPFNKVLWVLRSVGTPLTITARWGANPAVTAGVRPQSDVTPRADYPSYVNMPRAGCWTLDLAWGARRASIDIAVAPARLARSSR